MCHLNILEKKQKKSQLMKDKIDKYYEKKQKEIEQNNENEGEIKINKSLEHRDELKFIQNLDKSRSGRNVVPIPTNNSLPPKDRFSSSLGKGYILFFNKNFNQQNRLRSITKENEEENHNSVKVKENSVEKNSEIKNNKPYKREKPIFKKNTESSLFFRHFNI